MSLFLAVPFSCPTIFQRKASVRLISMIHFAQTLLGGVAGAVKWKISEMYKLNNTGITIFFILFCITLLSADGSYAETLKIHTVSVHGDAHIVQTPEGKTMLIDSGSAWELDKLKSFIDDLGIVSIDAVYLTHAHKDHFGGFTGEDGILATYHVAEFYGVDEDASKMVFNKFILPHSLNKDLQYQVIKRE